MARKGEVISDEVKAKQKTSAAETYRSKIKWELIDPYLDAMLDDAPAHRTSKRLTLAEFKRRIIAGDSLDDIKKDGYSKHVLSFFSRLASGKISFDPKEFRQAYLSGKSLEEIGKAKGIPRGDITFIREILGMKRKGAKFQERKRTEIPLTQRQKEILIGSLMGDATRMGQSSAKFKHGTCQRNYTMWKYQEFESVCPFGSFAKETARGKDGLEYESWHAYTRANSDVEKILSMFYGPNGKQVSQEILDQMTPLSIAVWYQDDGRSDHHYRQRKYLKEGFGNTECSFCTESFNAASMELIQKFFLEKHGIRTRLRPRSIGHRLIIENQSVQDFINLIRPHILPMFEYKIDYGAYVEHRRWMKRTFPDHCRTKTMKDTHSRGRKHGLVRPDCEEGGVH